MAHRRFEFLMPASSAVVFDAFHYHCWRSRWDSLVSNTHVVDGSPCPYIGAVTDNTGRGWLKNLSMRTQFVSFNRPHAAAAKMVGESFPFKRWAASMRHRDISEHHSLLIYTYTFDAAVAGMKWPFEKLVEAVFDQRTNNRFKRLAEFLTSHRQEVEDWQEGICA